MLGFLDDVEIIKQLQKANVFVCPSSIENSSNSIAEAITIGTPVICSKVGGNESFIIHEKNGFTYPYDEYYMLASYLKTIFLDANICKKFSEFNRFACTKFSFENNIDNMVKVYEKIERK